LLTFYNIWVGLTLLLYYFGPNGWVGASQPTVVLIVFTCMAVFNLGARTVPAGAHVQFRSGVPQILVKDYRLAVCVLIFFFFLSAIEVQQTTGRSLFSLSTWLSSDESVYNLYQQRVLARGSLSLSEMVLRIAKSLLFPIALTIFCAYFKRSWLLFGLFVVPMLGLSMARGTSKELFDLAALMFVASLFYGARKKLLVLGVVFAPIVLLLFTNRIIARFGGDIPQCVVENVCFDFNSALAQIHITLEVTYVLFSSYVTQGYEGMLKAVALQHEFTFGLGHLPPLQRIFEQLFNFDLSTYNERLTEAGWDTGWRWTSVYPILANDFHWLFLPAYFFVIGRSFGIARAAWDQRKDATALAMIMIVTIFMAYSSANMQIAINLDWTFATIMLIYFPFVTARVARPQIVHARPSVVG
jgi:hypothetical protein